MAGETNESEKGSQESGLFILMKVLAVIAIPAAIFAVIKQLVG